MTDADTSAASTSNSAFASDPEAVSQTDLSSWRHLVEPVNFIALVWALFQIALLVWPNTDIMVKRAGHLGFACALALAFTFPLRNLARPLRIGLGLVLMVVSVLPAVHLQFNLDRIYNRIAQIDPVLYSDYGFGLLLLVLVFIASRYKVGWGLVILTAAFVLYEFAGHYLGGFLAHSVSGFELFVDTMFLSQQGIFGIPTGISAEIIFYFILFAAIFDIYGGGRLIIDLTLWITGQSKGGPAKAAVVSSALTGSISGSAVANVMSTGIFTIPLMKRVGYSKVFAAGTEAAASTGGQIMPPVMGAGAFIMADFLQLPYYQVALGALIPALLYYLGLLVAVDLQARKIDLPLLTRAQIGSVGAALKERWHLLLPLVWLITQITRGYDIIGSVVQATLLTVLVGTLRPGTRQSVRAIIEALIRTSERAVVVALPCALASVIVMVIALTGLGTKFSAIIVAVSQGQLWLAVALGGLGCLILGCGMPTTSAYIMAAILVAPALAQLGIEPLVAHLYIFYVAVLANVTPPVALAAYAAASLAACSANAAGWRAFSLAMPGLAVAWAMVLQPSLVMWDGPLILVYALVQAMTANIAISIAMIGWLGRPLGIIARLVAVVVAVLMLSPSVPWTVVGAVLAVGLVLYGFAFRTPRAAASTAGGGMNRS